MTPFLLRVRFYLRRVELARINGEIAADHFGLSYSAFRRRLDLAGTSWGREYGLAKQNRFASLWMAAPGGPGKTYAYDCGYTEIESFYRAFQGWFGVSFGGFSHRFMGEM